jgi:hypothetical protein
MPGTFSTSPACGSTRWSFYATLIPQCLNPTGNERTIMYNTDSHTYQFCNGATWITMGKVVTGGGGGCSNPTASERAIIYNTDHNTYQFCNGTSWVRFSGGSVFGSPPSASSGYFVMSKTTWNGNLGGLAGADAKCLTDLTTNTGWRGYADANARGLLTASKVKAFFCTGPGGCNNLNANTTYYFANANDGTKGGSRFTTNGSGLGPNDSANWSENSYFGGTYTYWLNKSQGSAATWTSGPWSSTVHCGPTDNWDNSTNSYNGATANSNYSDHNRWHTGSSSTCDNLRNLICFVNP